jgi:hypothetical protein
MVGSRLKLAAVALVVGLSWGSWNVGASSLVVSQDSNVATGITTFGPSSPLMTWSNLFPPGTTWPSGALGPSAAAFATTATDMVTGSVLTAPTSLYVANWIDGPGFNLSGSAAGPDLAINGPENFKLSFTQGVTKIGLAVATGLSNYPGQTDHTGAVFQLTTNNGDSGILTLLDGGSGLAVWLTVQSSTPFTSLTFFEPSLNIEDQYFGNVVSSAVAATPLPAALPLFATGLGVTAWLARRRNRKNVAVIAAT